MSDGLGGLLETLPEIDVFQIREFENQWSDRFHVPNRHELLYVLDGKVTMMLEGGLRFPALAGDFLLIPAHVSHRDAFEPLKGLRVLMIQFSWDHAEEFFLRVTNRRLCELSFAARTEARRQLEYMRANRGDSPLAHYQANIQLLAVLLLFYRDLADGAPAPGAPRRLSQSELAAQAKGYIERNYAFAPSLAATARHLGISGKYLSQLFKNEYGFTFSEYLTETRLAAAAKLLRDGKLQVAEVASRCGFADSSYFIRVFREHFGKTPRNYR